VLSTRRLNIHNDNHSDKSELAIILETYREQSIYISFTFRYLKTHKHVKIPCKSGVDNYVRVSTTYVRSPMVEFHIDSNEH
jgi:hypothetical protein